MKANTRIALSHGNGGRRMRDLIDGLFAERLANPNLDTGADAVAVRLAGDAQVMLTTDGFTVQPLEFPGGNIGSLAIHGTVNDLAVAGADPLYLTLNAFLEEGLEVAILERLVDAMAEAAREAGVAVVAGDTKVLPRGDCSGVYFATTGVGVRDATLDLSPARCQAGDAVLVSGPVGDHGAAVMLAREAFGWQGEVRSDSASVLPLCRALRALPGLRCMRDPTRGGLATVANDLARASALTVRLQEADIPIDDGVRSVCEILGFDPLYLACEGRVVAVIDADQAPRALAELQRAGAGGSRIIGALHAGPPEVVLETELGGERLLDELDDDPLPRIC